MNPTPVYTKPPVTEVVCGITFKPLKTVSAPHLGLYWAGIRSEFPNCKEAEPLIPVIESFDEFPPGHQNIELPMLPRVWFISKDQNGIIQVQRDRFLQNWRKVRETDEYPRYETVKKQFAKHLTAFSAFLASNQLGTIELEQIELTYINHIYKGVGWEDLGNIVKVFPDFGWRTEVRFLPTPERINWRTSFLLPENSGRLHVSIQNAARRTDKKPLFLFELTVRGIHKERTIEDMWEWLDRAREWIVRGFTDLTGSEMHNSVWHRTA